MSRRKRWIVLGIAASIVILVLLPTRYYHIYHYGTDSYETHRPLSGSRVAAQKVTIRHPVSGAGAIIVNLRQAAQLTPVTVTATTPTGEILAAGLIAPEQIIDDQFAWATFDHTISPQPGEIILQFSVPNATAQNLAGIRFEQATGELAVGVIEKVSTWQQVQYWHKAHPAAAKLLMHGLVGAAAALLIGTAFERAQQKNQRLAWIVALMGIALIAVVIRVPIVRSLESVYGGDAFNYIFKSYAWVNGHDPFAADVRKAPLFSLLLLPGLLTGDPILWGRSINVIAATFTAVLLPVLLVRLNVPRTLAVAGGVLLAVNRDFRWESAHGLANVWYAALLLAAITALTYGLRARGAYLVGVLSALATLTRYEGGLIGVIVLPAVWLQHRLRLRWMIYSAWPAVILVSIPFILWPLTGQIGIRPPSDIAADGGLSVTYSVEDFWQNFKNFTLFFGRTWVFTPGVGKQWPVLGIGTVIGATLAAWRVFGRRVGSRLAWLPATLYCALFIGIIIRDSGPLLENLALLFTGVMGVGIGYVLITKPRYAIPIILVALTQIVAVTAILPKPRYYLQLIPLMTAALIAAVAGVSSWRTSRGSRAAALFFVGILIAMVWVDGNDALGGFVSDYNSRSQDTTVMLRAAKFLRQQSGTVALSTDDLSMRIMLTDQRIAVFRPDSTEAPAAAEQLAWLYQKRPAFLVESTANPLFSVTTAHPDYFGLVRTFTTTAGPASAQVFQVTLP